MAALTPVSERVKGCTALLARVSACVGEFGAESVLNQLVILDCIARTRLRGCETLFDSCGRGAELTARGVTRAVTGVLGAVASVTLVLFSDWSALCSVASLSLVSSSSQTPDWSKHAITCCSRSCTAGLVRVCFKFNVS